MGWLDKYDITDDKFLYINMNPSKQRVRQMYGSIVRQLTHVIPLLFCLHMRFIFDNRLTGEA